jgi:glycosyltransferase involved in cell wall biosynthesis
MELIIVDDGSKDKTLLRIINAISVSDISVKVLSGNWIGLGRARNTIVQRSRGKYLIWVDGDMILNKDFVKKLVEFMENAPAVGIAKGTSGIRVCQNVVGFLEDSYYFAFCSWNRGVKAKIVGTGGSICRCEVIRAVGGFDDSLSSVGEDIDLEQRVRLSGWSLYMQAPGVYYELRRTTWVSLWREYFWHGFGGSRVYSKNRNVFSLYKMTPLVGVFVGLLYSGIAYKFIRHKRVFLLPMQYAFKRIAWCLGFAKGQIIQNFGDYDCRK